MALLGNQDGAKPATPATSAQTGGTTAAVNAGDKKARKLEAAKRHAEKVQAQKKAFYEGALAFRDELVKAGYLDKLSAKAKEFVAVSCRSPSETSQPASGTQLFVTLFGANAKPGDQITLLDAFKKVQIAKGAFEKKFKEWEAKDNTPAKIEVIPNTDIMATVYKIVSIAA